MSVISATVCQEGEEEETGHPHRFSTDFEQTPVGGHLTRRVGCPRVPLGT
jgi:hypothetical protein